MEGGGLGEELSRWGKELVGGELEVVVMMVVCVAAYTLVLLDTPPPVSLPQVVVMMVVCVAAYTLVLLVVVMMVVCVAAYTLAWLPYHVFELAAHNHPAIFSWSHVKELYWAVHVVAMSHCCMNPIIYFTMNDKFRENLVLRCCGAARRRRREASRYTVECLHMQRVNGTRTSCVNSVKYDANRV
ncbi:RYamide receptor [Amphibalanus amphitrite]|uniref:RYamide receptor n=1 Tax=Amphibalanus amphitrite TaxID=1232801 RepID=A0A6A4WK64_AMPAM|nr:RYamide receptor [Amphibalanus amphitrite]